MLTVGEFSRNRAKYFIQLKKKKLFENKSK